MRGKKRGQELRVDEESVQKIRETMRHWQSVWDLLGMLSSGGGGLARVPNLRVQTPFPRAWHTQERKDELTSCRGTV